MINQEKFAKFIVALRKEKDLTQEDLAAHLFIGREAISKWERGLALPSYSVLLLLSEEFGVTINELLYGERKNETNEEEVEEETIKWLYKFSTALTAKVNKYKKLLIILFVLSVLVYLMSCFIFSYNSLKVYSLYATGEDFTINKGLVMNCNNKVSFQMGNVINHTDKEVLDISIYYGKDESKIKISSGTNLNDIAMNTGELRKLTKANLKTVLKDLYIEIKTEDNIINYKFDVDMNFKSHMLRNKDVEAKEDTDTSLTSLQDSKTDNIKSKFKLKDGKYVYEFKYKKKTYECFLKENNIYLETKDVLLTYKIGENIVKISSKNYKENFNVETNECETKNCDEFSDIIDMFITKILN